MAILKDSIWLLLYIATLWIVIFPITTFLHECGHAFTGLSLTNKEFTIQLGNGHNTLKLIRRRLHVIIGLFSGFVGYTRYDKNQLSTRHILLITIAGPIVSLVFAGLCFFLSALWNEVPSQGVILSAFAYANLAQLLFTIIPFRYPQWLPGYRGMTSDGWRILEILRGQSSSSN